MNDQPSRDTVVPELFAKFRPQVEACLALDEWSQDHRPTSYPTNDPAGMLAFWTYARSTKTYRASVRLCCLGYGVPAGMLNRSLWEDMLMAHWAKRHPDEAPELLTRHETWSLDLWHRSAPSGIQAHRLPGTQRRGALIAPPKVAMTYRDIAGQQRATDDSTHSHHANLGSVRFDSLKIRPSGRDACCSVRDQVDAGGARNGERNGLLS